MANRRNLKKDIRNICDLLLDECIAVMLIRKEVDEAALDAVMTRILNVKHDYLCRVSPHRAGTGTRLLPTAAHKPYGRNQRHSGRPAKAGLTGPFTPTCCAQLCRKILFDALGWRTEVTVPHRDKCIICVAPHTE